jgi:phospholipase C
VTDDEMSRRLFLAGAGTVGAAAILGACSSGGSKANGPGKTTTSRPVKATPTRKLSRPGERPHPDRPEGEDMLPVIGHIVVLMQENHSFDNYLGTLGRGDGLTMRDGKPTNTNAYGDKRLRSFPMPTACQFDKLPGQDWDRSHTAWGGGTNDGFVEASGPVAMGYWTESTLPYYHQLAKTFPLCDRWFSSCLAQTYPNRRFLIAGTALGLVSDPFPTIKDLQPPNGTIFDRLDAHHIDWADYYTSLPTAALFLKDFAATGSHAHKIDQFYADAAAGTLPGFCLVEPDFDHQSEENPQDIRAGETFTKSVIDALMRGPGWDKTVVIWCYDEHGGYYDHVPPPAAIPPDDIKPDLTAANGPGLFDRYGFRVPAVVISPYAKPNHVSHTVYDHTSVLKLVEEKWNLGALTFRDANASSPLDCLDLKAKPAFLDLPQFTRVPAGPAGPLAACTEGDPGGPIPPTDAVFKA